MTDLEKLAAELARRVHKNMERRFGYEVAFENETDTAAHFAEIIVEATEDARKQAYHSGFDRGREVGLIEGLEEAAAIAKNKEQEFAYKARGAKDKKNMDAYADGSAAAFFVAHAIDMRIQELKEQK